MFLTSLLPRVCVLCRFATKRAFNLCANCEQSLPILTQHCPQCAQKLPETSHFNHLCAACLKKQPPFDCTHACFPYEDPVNRLIIGLKFNHQLSYAKTLADLMIKAVTNQWYQQKPLPDLIIPIPLHLKRLRQRGFNQAVEIAKPIAKALEIPLDITHVQRVKHTARQSGLSAIARHRNLRQAFQIARRFDGLTVAVIDDVITTGRTMREFCSQLREHGAKRIEVWCCARN